ncbi:MAG: DEAD/DEAH box helicase family protein [Candidatus Jorgensenbacteria bacterium]|nr:DEAD/DEAH box helicase family protein [Candidatus Jorgensenbacteria bacterium]
MPKKSENQMGAITEQDARIVINRKLQEAGWTLEGANRNILTEQHSQAGFMDYLLLDRNGHNLALVEAKKDSINPYIAKNQARGYAEANNCRYVFLANSEQLYFWDLEEGDATPIERFISPQDLQRRHDLKQSHKPLSSVEHNDTICDRPYQKTASDTIAKQFDEGKRAFLLEMATGTGKTRLSAAIIDRFLKAHQAERVLFIVDRIELAKQALDAFQFAFKDDYRAVRYKPGQHAVFGGANIVVATIQSLNIHFREDFTPGYFDLVFNDEAHRSIYGDLPRQVVEYFQAVRIGLTATPNDFLKNIDVDKLRDDDPLKLEYRYARDTYKHFGCDISTPTFRFTIQDGVKGGYLVTPRIARMVSIITKEAVSEVGWQVEIDGENYTYRISQLERRVLVPKRNELICQQFLQNALKTPDGSIGKSIIFAVSQNHAVAIARELNRLTPEHNGKFAEVITSRVKGASDLAKQFRKDENFYPRIAVSVDMLTTGFDAPEVLNIVLARPIASPTTYIQIKGRGTRKYTFPDGTEKKQFLVHDFCEVVKYFEEEYDFEAPAPVTGGGGGTPPPPPPPPEVQIYGGVDEMAFTEMLEVGPEGEKVDRLVYISKWEKAIKEVLEKNPEIAERVKVGDDQEVEEFVRENVFDRPKDFFNERNLSRAYRVFAGLLDYVRAGLGTEKLPSREEQLMELVESIRTEHDLDLEQTRLLKILVKQLSQSSQLLSRFEKGDYAFLDEAPFSQFGGTRMYIARFDTKLGVVFDSVRTNPAIAIVE